MEHPTAYDYRMYDQVWKRVSPDPYGDITAAQQEEQTAPPTMTLTASPPSTQNTQNPEDTLPGADLNPCCMGSEAAESIGVLEGFIEEELAQRQCYLALSGRVCHTGATRLLRDMASGKLAAAQSLKSAYFLITGRCYADLASVDRMRWNSLADALRTAYHQEACNGLNYERAADETLDPCLSKLFSRLSEEAFARADAVMSLLPRLLC